MLESMRLGEARSEAEHAVEQSLRAYGERGPQVRYVRVAKGITNLNWLVDTGSRRLFLKLYGSGTSTFIDRTNARQASLQAGELGVGPKLLFWSEEPGCEIYEFLEGFRPARSSDLLEPDFLENLLRQYSTIHGSSLLPQTRTGFGQLEGRVLLAEKEHAIVPADLEQLLWQCNRVKRAIEAAGPLLGPCHNDSYLPNFMTDGEGSVKVVDWEYASNGDPHWDLSQIIFSGFDRKRIETVASYYRGSTSPGTAARLLSLGPVICTSWGLWAATQACTSNIAFDFQRYSWLLFRTGRTLFRDAAWERSLDTLA